MLSRIYTAGLIGIDGYGVTVECDFQDKLPCFGIVGLPDNAVKEAKDRIRAAFVNSGSFSRFADNGKPRSCRQAQGRLRL